MHVVRVWEDRWGAGRGGGQNASGQRVQGGIQRRRGCRRRPQPDARAQTVPARLLQAAEPPGRARHGAADSGAERGQRDVRGLVHGGADGRDRDGATAVVVDEPR
eukprot:929754-Rhodomonas_salina.1